MGSRLYCSQYPFKSLTSDKLHLYYLIKLSLLEETFLKKMLILNDFAGKGIQYTLQYPAVNDYEIAPYWTWRLKMYKKEKELADLIKNKDFEINSMYRHA